MPTPEITNISDAINDPTVAPILQGVVALVCLHGLLASSTPPGPVEASGVVTSAFIMTDAFMTELKARNPPAA